MNRIFLAIFLLIVFVSKFPVLGTPYYWDELGWILSVHWLAGQNLLRALPGFHPYGMFFGHPPGLHVSMALLFKIFGESIWLSHFFIVCFSFVGVYFTYLLGSHLFGKFTGIFAALFLFFSPIYFAQSAMYLGDIPVTAMGVMSLYFGLRKRFLPYLAASIYLVFVKETGAAIILAFLLYVLITDFKKDKRFFLEILKYSVPLWLVLAFAVGQKITAGKFLGIYAFEVDIYKHTADAMFTDFATTLKWIFIHQYRFLFTILIVTAFAIRWKRMFRKEMLLFVLLFVMAVLPFSYFYLLPRYLLPFLPYFFLAAALSLSELLPSIRIRILAGLAIITLFIFSLSGSTSYGNNEWNMKYVRIVGLHKSMCTQIEREFPRLKILTVFPFSKILHKPNLGYVTKPLKVVGYHKKLKGNDWDLVVLSNFSQRNEMMRYVERDKMILVTKLAGEGVVLELYKKRKSK